MPSSARKLSSHPSSFAGNWLRVCWRAESVDALGVAERARTCDSAEPMTAEVRAVPLGPAYSASPPKELRAAGEVTTVVSQRSTCSVIFSASSASVRVLRTSELPCGVV